MAWKQGWQVSVPSLKNKEDQLRLAGLSEHPPLSPGPSRVHRTIYQSYVTFPANMKSIFASGWPVLPRPTTR